MWITWSGFPDTTGTNKSDDGGSDSLTPRGFTGHEMLDDLGLVHMNGRIYDPLLGRMLSADGIIPGTDSLQSYNRYTYVLNNPLRYDDPDGHAPRDVAAGVIEGPAYAIVNSGSVQSAAPLSDAARTNKIFASVADFFGAHDFADSVRHQAERYEKGVAEAFKGGELLKADISERVSKFTGSEDINHPQRAAARNVTEVATVVGVSFAAAKLTDRLAAGSPQSPDAGSGKLTIHDGKQGKHVPSHNNFDEKRGRSELTHSDAQALLDQHAGTGIRNGQHEHIDTESVVGVHVTQDGTRQETTRITIHYGLDGTAHIVPAPPAPPKPPPPPPPARDPQKPLTQ